MPTNDIVLILRYIFISNDNDEDDVFAKKVVIRHLLYPFSNQIVTLGNKVEPPYQTTKTGQWATHLNEVLLTCFTSELGLESSW